MRSKAVQKDKDIAVEDPFIGLYEMLKLAQPDLNYNYSFPLDKICEGSKYSQIVDKEK